MTERPALRFGKAEAEAAAEAWGFNCGPGALCAVLGKTPDELRPHLGGFEVKGYTNPSLMFEVLRGLQVRHRQVFRSDAPKQEQLQLHLGLMRVQWDGPWTRPGVPMAARYRKTHWVAVCGDQVFDVNALSAGGWISWDLWSTRLVPWLIKAAVPGGSGLWWPTHGIECADPEDWRTLCGCCANARPTDDGSRWRCAAARVPRRAWLMWCVDARRPGGRCGPEGAEFRRAADVQAG